MTPGPWSRDPLRAYCFALGQHPRRFRDDGWTVLERLREVVDAIGCDRCEGRRYREIAEWREVGLGLHQADWEEVNCECAGPLMRAAEFGLREPAWCDLNEIRSVGWDDEIDHHSRRWAGYEPPEIGWARQRAVILRRAWLSDRLAHAAGLCRWCRADEYRPDASGCWRCPRCGERAHGQPERTWRTLRPDASAPVVESASVAVTAFPAGFVALARREAGWGLDWPPPVYDDVIPREIAASPEHRARIREWYEATFGPRRRPDVDLGEHSRGTTDADMARLLGLRPVWQDGRLTYEPDT